MNNQCLEEIENCLLCGVIADPLEVIQNTLDIINRQKSVTHKYPMGFQELLVVLDGAENLPQELFDAAWREGNDRPTGYDDYLSGIWPQWKRGGFHWLSNRSNPRESQAIFDAVIRFVKLDNGQTQ